MTPVIEQHNRRRFPRAAYGIILAAVGCAALLVLAARPDGRPAVTSDSFQYFSMGEHAAAGEGFRSCCAAWNGPPGSDPPVAADWGPGYPLVLAGIEAAGVDPQGRALLVWIAFRLLAFYDEAQARFQSRAALENDPSLAWIKTNLAEATLYSNNYDYLAYLLPDADVRDLPLHAAGERVPSAFVEQVGGGYMVFLDYNQRAYLLRESDVVDSQQFDLVMTLPRARVYQPSARQTRNEHPVEDARFPCAYHFEEEDGACWSRWGYD